ncbi:MAG: hypothetical protein N2489_07950 [Clostridia bacterium]|nr:hypothetical protein [Clostridia bacterium]
MSTNSSKIKLNDYDRKIIINNSNICTESHAGGCKNIGSNEANKKLN